MGSLKRRSAAIVVIIVVACTALVLSLAPASAFDPNGNVYWFDYNVDASTHMKTLDQTIDIHGGRFKGGIDFGTGELLGNITLPATTFTFKAAGIVGLLTATAKIVPAKPVTGMVDLSTLSVTATSVFNIRLVDAHVNGTTTNLVGNYCITSAPVTVTMSGQAALGEASTFSGEFTMPPFKGCGTLKTPIINAALAGPGNTFTATATPRG